MSTDMEYSHFEPPTEETSGYTGPTKQDFVMQIEADHFAGSQVDPKDENYLARLVAKKKAVEKAKNDQAASDAYNADYSDVTA